MIKIKLKTFLIVFIFLLINCNIFSQVNDSTSSQELFPFVVDSIKISGNKTTENFVILKELTFTVGDTISEQTIYYNRERIYSLGIFNHVFLIPEINNDIKILNIEVEESWYIYPIPFIATKENDFNKLSYGLFLRVKNFRGRNEELNGSFSFGYDPSFYISYYNPDITSKENIFISGKIGYSDVSNKSPSAEILYGQEFSQKYIFTLFTIGKRFGLFHKFYTNISYNYIETPIYFPRINASNDRIDNRFDIGVGYEYDTRDLIQFPQNGVYANINYTLKGLGIDNINYSVGWIDFREYRNLIDELVAKWRIASRLTFGKEVPYYDYSIIGLDDKIRGHFTQKYEGDNYYFSGLEFYYPIIKELNVDLTFIPIIPDQLLSYRVGFYTQMFVEAGVAQVKGIPLKFSDFKSGYGAGITLLFLPYNVFRIDFALDEYKHLETLINIGISY